MPNLPDGFTFLKDIDPTIIESVRYFSSENFLGRQVAGYKTNRIICTKIAAESLKLVHDDLKSQGYGLVVYDGYRPQAAPDEFLSWSTDPNDQLAKKYYYPTIDKADMFDLGYVARKSSHSRGSTFDLTLIKLGDALNPIIYTSRMLENGEEIPYLDDNTINMGTSFDLFNDASHHDTKLVTEEQNLMREILRKAMKNRGFNDFSKEWWHYTLAEEPYPDIYFDFIYSA